jgi:RNA polymerase sigma-70 factor (ECF subfamily)
LQPLVDRAIAGATERASGLSPQDMDADRELVRRVLAGDLRAFRQLVSAHQKLVTHIVARMLDDPRDCEELCQDVFIRVHARLGTFRFEARLSTWIAKIAYHLALNSLERRRPVHLALDAIPTLGVAGNGVADSDLFEAPARGPDGSDKLHLEELTSIVHLAVDALPLGYRTVVTLYYLQELAIEEIAHVMGLPEGTVKSYLFRARRLLRERLTAQYGVEDLKP